MYLELAKSKLVNRNGTMDATIKSPQVAFKADTNNRSSLLYYVSFESGTITLWNNDLE